jgi:Fe2+ or Zn2+ uptake regulation protein
MSSAMKQRVCVDCGKKLATPDPELPTLAREQRYRLGILDAHCTNPACTWCETCPKQRQSDALRRPANPTD